MPFSNCVFMYVVSTTLEGNWNSISPDSFTFAKSRGVSVEVLMSSMNS